MCQIQQFDVVYPDGTRQGREQVVACHRGTRSQPCNHTETVRLEDRPAIRPPMQPHMQPYIVPIAPRDQGSSRLYSSSRERTRGPIEGMTVNFKLCNPFSSSKNKERRNHRPPPIICQPCPPYWVKYPDPLPPHPPGNHPPHQSPHQTPEPEPPAPTHEEDEDKSSSPPQAHRPHSRRTRSLSRFRRYELERYEREKEAIRRRELEERDRRIIRREEREAWERAVSLERQERQERRECRRLRAAEQAILQQERDRELARIEQEREDRRADRARRLWEEDDLERRRAADRARRRWEEERRLARAQQANIPRNPRHPVFVYQGYPDRGEQYIQGAIRAEDRRQFERRNEWRERYDNGALRRRNTIDGGHGWYDGRGRR